MAVTKVNLLGASGGESATEVEYGLRYHVVVDSRGDGPLTVRNAVPWRYGDVYAVGQEVDFRARAKSIKESQASSKHFGDWFVDVEFGDIDEEKDLSNPLNDLVQIEMQWQGQARRIWVDATGTIIANTAGEVYPEGLEVDDNLPTMTYSLNQVNFSTSLAMAIRNSINSLPWKGFPAGTVKLRSMTASRLLHKNIGIYYGSQYVFNIQTEAFIFRTESMGLNELVGVAPSKKLQRIQKSPGEAVWTQVPLKADGSAVIFGVPDPNPNNLPEGYYGAAIQDWAMYPTLNYNVIFGFL